MSYKIKSLLYFLAFVASAFLYHSMNGSNERMAEEAHLAQPVKLDQALNDHMQMDAQGSNEYADENIVQN